MPLKIRLKPHEKIFVNGAVIAAGDQAAVFYFLNSARILLEKDILTEQDADTPEAKLYFLLQLIYLDPPSQARYAEHLPQAVQGVLERHPNKIDAMETILAVAAKGDYFKAMRIVKAEFDVDPGHGRDDDEDDHR